MMRKQNYSPDDNIDELVFAFQDGDQEAALELLKIYGGYPIKKDLSLYLGKFYKMLRYGKLDLDDRDSRLFISLFLEDPLMGKEMRKAYQYKPTQQAARRKLQNLEHSLRVMTDDDLKQELIAIFLKVAKKYKKVKKNVDFNGYLYNYYRFEVANFIKKLLQPDEMYVKHPDRLVRLADDLLEDEDSAIELQESILLNLPMIQAEEELDVNWVRGLTCGEEFKELTPLQRLIIKLNYEDGWSDGKIADMMGIHINTIFRQRKKADAIVKETVEKLIQEGFYQRQNSM
jgi:DNA-directed RNA polymerase specialized sigma24 family protein